jgi:hypothetical protein
MAKGWQQRRVPAKNRSRRNPVPPFACYLQVRCIMHPTWLIHRSPMELALPCRHLPFGAVVEETVGVGARRGQDL